MGRSLPETRVADAVAIEPAHRRHFRPGVRAAPENSRRDPLCALAGGPSEIAAAAVTRAADQPDLVDSSFGSASGQSAARFIHGHLRRTSGANFSAATAPGHSAAESAGHVVCGLDIGKAEPGRHREGGAIVKARVEKPA